ncbi:hypothetical protein JYT86_00445 [bacterium AH-315-N03]|nr:hypothetical protein [bacterium AH-315-N03]
MRTLFSIALVAALATGCFGNESTPLDDASVADGSTSAFPPYLEPWEDPNEADPPEATPTEMYPEEVVFIRRRWVGGAAAVHARAYVHADVSTTFEAVRTPLAGADRRESVTFTWEDDVDSRVPWSHRSHLVIPDVVTVEFELTWLSDIVEGNADAPTMTATRWQKTWGTTAIPLLEGSIVCVRVTDTVTELQIQYHLDSLGGGHETIEDYVTGYFESILALVRGEPLPIQE